ncbi:UNVERIFIED_CONTAM: hypothetical protein Sradi_3246200 [Sesamum radiatum]|uniref:CCHC-type domain-containing protein n=1 Tax=Sesamum radiatum TaxID=300843 RepID=A0AAW2QZG5_SESRA
MPINGRDKWKKSDSSTLVPPKAVKRVGRPPKSNRRLEPDEAVQKQKKRRGAPMKEGSSKIKRQQTTFKCEKCGSQGHNTRGCAIKTASNEPIPDVSSQVPLKEQPQKIKKGKAIMQEEDVVMHRRTRSGHISAVAPVIRKRSATAPSMFQ